MLDLLVIGAGLSGLMAAYTAVQAGLSVRVINKGLGSMHWSAGAIDLLGYTTNQAHDLVKMPFDAIAKLAEDNHDHPYALLDLETITNALDAFHTLTQEIGLPYGRAADRNANLLLPSPLGTPRPTYLAPHAQIAGDLGRPEPMLIVGFHGLRDFYPHTIVDTLIRSGYQARAAFLPLDLLTNRRDANTVQLARELDDGARRAKLAQEIKRLVQSGERIGLPAILGLNQSVQVWSDIEKICDASVFEIPTLPPSVPGMRLYAALRQKLERLNVRIEPAMEVTAANTAPPNGAPGRVQWVASETSARPLQHRAEKFLLATGGILGGGFNSDPNGRIWETIFDLPVTAPQDRSQWFNASFLSPDGHPVFHGGVAVNKNFQPVNAQGEVIYANLWAAGHLLAGADPILERSVEGEAIITGMAAGMAASNV